MIITGLLILGATTGLFATGAIDFSNVTMSKFMPLMLGATLVGAGIGFAIHRNMTGLDDRTRATIAKVGQVVAAICFITAAGLFLYTTFQGGFIAAAIKAPGGSLSFLDTPKLFIALFVGAGALVFALHTIEEIANAPTIKPRPKLIRKREITKNSSAQRDAARVEHERRAKFISSSGKIS